MRFFCISIYIVIMMLSIAVQGQSLHYSQFFSSPLHLNPALTGVIDSHWRFTNNIRTQGMYFGDPLNTTSVSYDQSVNLYKTKLGLGVLYSYDNAAGPSLPTHKIYASGSSMVQVSERSYIGAGLQVGWVMRSLQYGNFSFPEQYDRETGGFNSLLPTSENFLREFANYPDVNLGALWNYQGEGYLLSTGLAMYHVNGAKDYFLNDNKPLRVRSNWHGSIKVKLNEQLYLLPQSYYTFHNKASEFLIGSNVGMNLKSVNQDFRSISAGIYIRDGIKREFESMIFLLGLNYRNWTAISSFDVDISGLKTTNIFTNAFELTLIYQRPLALLKKTTIPCIRY
ncbi:type IX secretion system membrane protein, PorP/SprF family [Saccharicrinis carchari]|uniref:Type IX secretion system membrane protein, PorP/SprF family n=1 Tax=Saccharicrinis carchari TaxID=1168039 RepID=A0A521AS46_SACCC|nr:PorP/SprF family type IX secretion system membrane protein [Saccharicrinis carchari]SMO37605.1 type IX secretion system membrane protein, PorP/SprF family [Saccharicrinis carchari]